MRRLVVVGTAIVALAFVASGTAKTAESARHLRSQVHPCIAWIVDRETGGTWDVRATNPKSGAYGLPQALPGSKMASAGPDWRTNPRTQLRWMLGYVNARYGGACNAVSFWRARGWY